MFGEATTFEVTNFVLILVVVVLIALLGGVALVLAVHGERKPPFGGPPSRDDVQ